MGDRAAMTENEWKEHSRKAVTAMKCAFRRIRSAVPTTSGQSFRGIRSAEDRCRLGMALMSGAVAFVNDFGGVARAAQ